MTTTTVPGWARLVFLQPRTVAGNLERLRRSGHFERVPNLWQVFLGTLYMRHRLLFRPDTVGTSEGSVRQNLRARLLRRRPIRFPFLVWERAIAPLDLSGLGLDADRLVRHLLGAHHDGAQFSYDLELLRAYGALEDAMPAFREAARQDSARARWLADLCVYEGYHASLAAAAEALAEGRPIAAAGSDTSHPDVSLAAWLGWCADQPKTPGDTLSALRGGTLRFSPAA